MLNITNLNFFRNATLNRPQSKTAGIDYRSINSSSLAPLAADTISFGANKANLNKSLYDAFDNIEACTQVHENAAPAEKALKKSLTSALEPFVYSKTNPHGMILKISTRIKEPDSIKEKIAGELEHAITKDKTKIFNPTNPQEIKSALGDIVGARITLRKSDNAQNSQMIDALIKEVKRGRLKITKIQHYEAKKEDLNYFQKEDLERLTQVANEYRAPNSPKVELCCEEKKTGYMALHLDVDLSDENLLAKNNNYKGEIQIIGYDVEKLKDVDDLCYKLRHDKAIKGGHPAYKVFDSWYKKYSTGSTPKETEDLQKDLMEYTSRAYLAQRRKEPISTSEKTKKALPTLKQCGMEGKIPPQLDFNKLAEIKKKSDELYEISKNM